MLVVSAIVSFLMMEFVAWFTHKYVMHGFLWNLHVDHHKRDHHHGFFEKNDYFFLIFATPGIASIIAGSMMNNMWIYGIGIGISIYGMAYFVIHDIFIHQRFKIFRHSDHVYLRAIRRAHKMHHKHLSREDGECFGMLFVPIKYIRQEMKLATAK